MNEGAQIGHLRQDCGKHGAQCVRSCPARQLKPATLTRILSGGFALAGLSALLISAFRRITMSRGVRAGTRSRSTA